MNGYEPASGWNLPPGCFEADVDRAMGAPWPPAGATCGTCCYAREVAMADGSRILACDCGDELTQVFEGAGGDCECWDGVTAA